MEQPQLSAQELKLIEIIRGVRRRRGNATLVLRLDGGILQIMEARPPERIELDAQSRRESRQN